jgi:hypothetical protein
MFSKEEQPHCWYTGLELLEEKRDIAAFLVEKLLEVTIDQIRPPIKVQNRRIEQTFDTYAYIINLVPLVLEKTCFAGHTLECKWKINKRCSTRKRKVEKHKGAKQKPIQKPILGRAPMWTRSRPT